MNLQKNLIILPNNLGDVVMTLPVLEGLKKKFSSEIHFLVESGFEDGLSFCKYCDKVILFPRGIVRDSFKTPEWKKGIKDVQDFVNSLKEEKYDQVLNFCQHPYISYITTLIGANFIKGNRFSAEGNQNIDDLWSQYLYAIPFARKYNTLHATDVYRRIADVADVDPVDYFSGSNEYEALQILQSKGLSLSKRRIVFQPGAAYSSKRWPVENFIILGKRLISDNWEIVITGAPAEKEIADAIQNEIAAGCVSVAGDLTFRETIQVAGVCEACVTGDTALMHVMAALKKKVYALFGPTNPVETGPYGPGHTVIVGKCNDRPCFCIDCKSKLCMKSILPQDVYSIINDSIPSTLHCEVFETEYDSDLKCQIIHSAGKPSYDNSYIAYPDALIIKDFFENKVNRFSSNDAFDSEIKSMHMIVTEMEKCLNLFLSDNIIGHVQEFERKKAELTNLRGVGAFFTAIFNIRLNSIPLLNPMNGLKLSRQACTSLLNEISGLLK